MANIEIDGQTVAVAPDQSVLDALLEAGYPIPYSCQSGVCHSCLMRCREGELPPRAREGLSAEQKAKGLFLSCSCYPQQAIRVSRYSPAEEQLSATVVSKRHLHPEVLELQLQCPLNYRGGQYVTLWRNDTIARSYSIASTGADECLSFHIAVRADGQFSHWAEQTLQPGDKLGLIGPMGECVYQGNTDEPMLLVGVGTGIAPLFAIAREALEGGHRAKVHILACARTGNDLYWQRPLQQLGEKYDQLQVRFLVLEPPVPLGAERADVYPLVRQDYAPLNEFQVFLCGAPSFVQKLRKQCFLAGARPRQVHCDAFEAGK